MAPVVDRQYVCTLAQEAMRLILEAGKKAHDISTKLSKSDLVTESDVAVETYLIKKIKSDFPDHHIISEETSEVKTELPDGPTWIIDPIDGTTNFIHTFPIHAVSIGYAEEKKLKIGVVGVPCTNELFSAERGKGAFLNEERIHVAMPRDADEALVSTGFCAGPVHQVNNPQVTEEQRSSATAIRETIIQNFTGLMDNFNDIRRMGACAVDLCYVARGAVDAFCEFGPHEWDVAAGIVIVEEAGGVIADYHGKPINIFGRHIIAASCPKLLDAVAKVVKVPAVDLKKF